jgi:hypothetical protein
MASDLAGMTILGAKLAIAIGTVKNLMHKIKEIEANDQMPAIQKLSEIKKIRAELDKVGMEIDSVKKEINLLNAYRVN